MPEGISNPDIGPPKPPPAERKHPPKIESAPSAEPIGPAVFDPSITSALERAASIDPRVASLMERSVAETSAPKTESREKVELETPEDKTLAIDPEHPMSDEPGNVIAKVTEELKKPKEPIGMMATPDDETLPAAPPAAERDVDSEGEKTLQYYDREILITVRGLGDFEERANKYRISSDGRAALRELQNRLRSLRDGKLRRIKEALPQARRGLKAADDALKVMMESLEGEEKDGLGKVIKNLRIPQSERHRQAEGEDNPDGTIRVRGFKHMTSAELEVEGNEIEAQRDNLSRARFLVDMNQSLLDSVVSMSEEERERRKDDIELARQRIDNYNNEVKNLERKEKSFAFWQSQKFLDGLPDENPLKQFVKVERHYNEILEERKKSRESEVSVDENSFNIGEDFALAQRRYEDSVGVNNTEASEAKSVIDAYFREANKIGLFKDFNDLLFRTLNQGVDPRMRYSNADLVQDKLGKLEQLIAQFEAQASTHVARFAEAKVARGEWREGQFDADKYKGVTEEWLKRAKEYLRQMNTRSEAENVFEGEFTLTPKGQGWYFSEAGYIVVEPDLKTVEDFERAMITFAEFLVSGAIDRDPSRMFQEMQQFDRIFSPAAARRHGNEKAEQWRLVLKAMVTFWAGEYYAMLGNTQNVQAVLHEAFKGVEGVEVLGNAYAAYDGLVGLATRKIERKRRYRRPLHQYFGENGGLAFEGDESGEGADPGGKDIRAGGLEYLVRNKTEFLLAEDLMVYDLSNQAVQGSYTESGSKHREENVRNLQVRQTSDEYENRFLVNKRVFDIREKVREGKKLTAEEEALYRSRLKRAADAVSFARKISGALGERALNASPAYIVKVYSRNAEGKLLNQAGLVLEKAEESKKGVFARGRERFMRPFYGVKKYWDYLRTGEQQQEKSKKYINGEPHIERVDYIDKNYSVRFMQFAENLAWVMVGQENKRRRERGERPFNAWEISRKAREYRRRAKLEIARNGFGAQLRDENGNLIYFQFTDGRVEGKAYQDGVKVNLDTAKTFASEAEAAAQGYFKMDFDEATAHVLSRSCKEIYLSLQQEIRSQLLMKSTREAALRIRRGESLPEEEDVVASMLLQIDPTLTRLRPSNDSANIDLVGAHVYGSFWNHFRIIRELDRQFVDPETGAQEMYYGVPNERFSWKELLWSGNKLFREQKRFGRRGFIMFANSPVHAMSFADRLGTDISGAMGIVNRNDLMIRKEEMEVTDSNVLADIVDRISKNLAVLVRFAKGGQLGNDSVVSLALKPFNDIDAAETEAIEKSLSKRGSVVRVYQALRKCVGRLEDTLKAIETQDQPVATGGAMLLETADVRYINKDGEPVVIDEEDDPMVYAKAEILRYNQDGHVDNKNNGNEKLDADNNIIKRKGDNFKQMRVLRMPFLTPVRKGEPKWVNIADVGATMETGAGPLSASEFLHSAFIPYADEVGRRQYGEQAWVITLMGRKIGFGAMATFWKYFDSKAIRTGIAAQ